MMGKFLYTFFFLLMVTFIPAQDNRNKGFRITGKIRVEQGLVEGSKILLYKATQLQSEAIINRTGNFVFSVELGFSYRMVFAKEGFYPKEIEIDTRVPSEVCSGNCVFPPYQLSIFLLKTVPGVELEQKKAGKIAYNPVIDNFDIVKEEKITDRKKTIEEAIRTTRDQSAQLEKLNLERKKTKYQALLNDANQLYRGHQYQKAMETYRDAVLVLPFETFPRQKVDELYQLLAIEQMEETFGAPSQSTWPRYLNYGDSKMKEREATLAMVAFSQVMKIRSDDQEARSKLQTAQAEVEELKKLAESELSHKKALYSNRTIKYNELINLADKELRAENYSVARDNYALAAGQIDENSYAMLMLKKIDEILNDDELAQKLAREREEQEKLFIREAREKAYRDAVTEADRLFENRLYRDAIEYYELSLTIKSWEFYPKNQIRIINDLIAKLQSGGAEYNRLLREGEELFNNQLYAESKASYQNAHMLLPNETFALAQIKKIDDLLARLEKERQNHALYQGEIQKADALFQQKQYNEAIAAYLKAQTLKPGEKYPGEQVRKIRDLMAKDDETLRAKLKQQTDYDQAIALADQAFEEKSYPAAKMQYQRALTVWPGKEYPMKQIEKIDQILSNLSKSGQSQSVLDRIDFNNLDKESIIDKEAAYKEALAMGNSFVKSKEWGVARFYFRKALALKPGDSQAQDRLNDVEMQLRGGNVNESLYQEMIKKGDEAFRGGDFSIAKFYYSKALEAKPSDTYGAERVGVAQQMINTEAQRTSNKEFDQAIRKGDEALAQKNFPVARFFYRKAQAVKPGDPLVNRKISELENATSQTKNSSDNQSYQKYVDQGNTAMKNGQYAVAKNYFRQALSVLPDEIYPKQQIVRIDSIIAK